MTCALEAVDLNKICTTYKKWLKGAVVLANSEINSFYYSKAFLLNLKG